MTFNYHFKIKDKEALFIRETRVLLISGVMLCLFSVHFMVQKIYFKHVESEFQKPYDANADVLNRTAEEGLNLILRNPICQLYNKKSLDQGAIEFLEIRLTQDSIEALYQKLTDKGWKVESEIILKDRFLNANLMATLRQYEVNIVEQKWLLEETRVKLLAYQLYRDDYSSRQIEKANLFLLVMLLFLYPIRLIGLWWKNWNEARNLANDDPRKWLS